MTTSPDDSLRLAVTTSGRELRITLAGDLDFDTADGLTRTVREHLAAHPAPDVLVLDCARLAFCDSTGLATLLMAHRLAAGSGTALHLHDRPGFLDRLLRQTGTLDHLVRPDHADDQEAHTGPPRQP
ncbi:STAS domain-containing protein [Streptomyces somaliensis DSM 40738]|uniref:STAS domain-containing protein n=1 Tax=Streptomyces somaliensis TaxID=78355 RepID=UPI0021C32DEF|nr:STAS domain-containing protein [Streptomyces somaliensis]MCQ0025528.1 STAS domain-containing protein [Streptomyces somaliensis DSM 40738]